MPVIANDNSYLTVAEADAYLADDIETAAWQFVPDATKQKALITATRIFEDRSWQGAKNTLQVIDTLAITAGGTGYTVNDILTVVGGTGLAARITVTAVSSGVITGATVLDAGLYSVAPSSPAGVTGGSGGDDATFTLTFKDQPLHFPATGLTDKDGNALSDTVVPQEVKDGLAIYAYDLSQNAAVAAQGGQGNNIKAAGAGSARVEFFRATASGPNGQGSQFFRARVHNLVKCFLQAGSISAPYAGGTDVESGFDDDGFCRGDGFA